MSTQLRLLATIVAAALLPAGVSAAAELATTVEFSPAVSARMQDYGESERAALESAVTTAISRETGKLALPAGLKLRVTVEDLAPTHPTRGEVATNPSVSPTASHFLGGAELAGELEDASGHALKTVRHRYFPPTLKLGSASVDPWADARLAIDQFAHKVAAACRALPSSR